MVFSSDLPRALECYDHKVYVGGRLGVLMSSRSVQVQIQIWVLVRSRDQTCLTT